MHVLSFTNGVEFTFDKSGGPRKTIVAGYTDYVFSNIQRVHGSADKELQQKIFRQSYLEARLPPFKVNPLGGKGEHVLFYTGAGGYGDQLMAQPVVQVLHRLGYIVDALVDPGNEPCWQGLDFIRQIITLPVPLDDVYAYNHLALYEFVTNADGHPGQMHPTDNILFRMGLDPKTVPDEDKRIKTPLTMSEQMSGESWSDKGIYQLASSNPLRNLSPKATADLFKQIQDLTGYKWVAIADKYLPQPYYDECAAAGIQSTFLPDIRELIAAMVYAKLAVGPDSFMTHVRGHNLKPGVFYFGTIEPVLRTLYYPTIKPVWMKERCQFSPCHIFANTFPPWCPGVNNNSCAVIADAPNQVLKEVKNCLQSSK